MVSDPKLVRPLPALPEKSLLASQQSVRSFVCPEQEISLQVLFRQIKLRAIHTCLDLSSCASNQCVLLTDLSVVAQSHLQCCS